MSQRDLFYKWLFYCLLALGWMALQQLVLNHCSWWGGVHPFVWPMVPVMIALLEKRAESCTFAIFSGLLNFIEQYTCLNKKLKISLVNFAVMVTVCGGTLGKTQIVRTNQACVYHIDKERIVGIV